MKSKEQLEGEIRYALRLTERTARLYRRIQSSGIFLSILGGSATFASIATETPSWITIIGGVLLAFSGAALIAIRPADKAAQNEADTKRYRLLATHTHNMDLDALALAIKEAHIGDAPEIEALRDVAYNDVVIECNRGDALIPLSITQTFLSKLA